MPRNANKLWTDQDELRLQELAASGATLVRATAALRRSSSSVKRKALDLGLKLRGEASPSRLAGGGCLR